jgi:cobalt-zinc-cadmium efflux system membrane fusion protein
LKRLALLLLVVACNRPKPTPTSEHAEPSASTGHEHEGLQRVVHLSPDVAKAAHVETAPVKKDILRASLLLPGEIAANPDKSGRISSPVAGRIESVTFQEGASVKKGDAMITLRVPDLGKLRGALAATQSKSKAARANADRLKDLSGERLASQQAAVDAEAEAQALAAEEVALSAQLSAVGAGGGDGFHLVLRAPASGVVTRRDAVVGQPVTADQALGSIADLDAPWFLARVFEKDLGRLEQGASADVELNAYPNEHFAGTVEVIAQQIDPVARTLTARIGLKNRKNLLRVGLFGSARVDVGNSAGDTGGTPVLLVPRSALTRINEKDVVFVQTGADTFELHDVVIGESAVGKVQIVAGLREGEPVVTHGVFTLKSLVLKGTFAEEE